ncbi:MAG: AMP-binding protein, partial [Hyphomicrobiales bacterium]|nr:AMP-binding protein [Hyphomicrobiales bacterium]
MTAPIPPLVDGPERAKRANEDTRPALDEASFNKTLFEALLDARAIAGGNRLAVEDVERQPLSYDKLLLAAMVLGGRLEAITVPGEHVGVFLPNSVGVAATFFALQAFGRVPAMLNFSSGIRNVEAACTAGEVRTILTSRRFVEIAKLESYIEALGKNRRIVWLDDIKASLTLKDKLTGVMRAKTARRMHRRRHIDPGDIAVLLFTSGTEGLPKGVALTHRNMLANCHQADITFELEEGDRIFNPLPVFHSFGLMAGMILPIVRRLPTFLYPSPLHYRQIPPLVKKFGATILFGTDTFL